MQGKKRHIDIFSHRAHIGGMEPNEIKAFREARGQSQSAFGADLEVDLRTIQRWEHGDTRPPGKLLDLACKQLDNCGACGNFRVVNASNGTKNYDVPCPVCRPNAHSKATKVRMDTPDNIAKTHSTVLSRLAQK